MPTRQTASGRGSKTKGPTRSSALKEHLVYLHHTGSPTARFPDRRTFTAFVIVGDQKGQVAYGQGSGPSEHRAVQNAVGRAEQYLRRGLVEGLTVATRVVGASGSTTVTLAPAPSGQGIVVEPADKADLVAPIITKVLECAGVRDVSVYVLGGVYERRRRSFLWVEEEKLWVKEEKKSPPEYAADVEALIRATIDALLPGTPHKKREGTQEDLRDSMMLLQSIEDRATAVDEHLLAIAASTLRMEHRLQSLL